MTEISQDLIQIWHVIYVLIIIIHWLARKKMKQKYMQMTNLWKEQTFKYQARRKWNITYLILKMQTPEKEKRKTVSV